MQRMSARLHHAVAKLAVVATAGVVSQTTGCTPLGSGTPGTVSGELVPELTRLVLNTLITAFANDQLGVQGSLVF